jgi:hypothetical protein
MHFLGNVQAQEACTTHRKRDRKLELFSGDLLSQLVLAAGAVSVDLSSGWVTLAIALIALSAMEIVLGIDNNRLNLANAWDSIHRMLSHWY